MKNLFLLSALMLGAFSTFAQFNTPWTTNTSNSASSGYIGVGTKSTNGATNTPLPSFNFQVHGVADYIESVRGGGTFNHGKTSRIGLTNSISGNASDDGAVLRMSENNFSILNQENGNLTVGVPSLSLIISNSTNRIWLGGSIQSSSEYAKFNIVASDDDGLLIKTMFANRTALKIRNFNDAATAIEVFGTSTTVPNVKVLGSGLVYCKKIAMNVDPAVMGTKYFHMKYDMPIPAYSQATIFVIENTERTLLQLNNDGALRAREIFVDAQNPWPDYVFESDYSLPKLTDVKNYVQQHKHLPNVPSASEVAENGINVGEMNKILLEKVEQLTLYLIEQQERIEALENEVKQLK